MSDLSSSFERGCCLDGFTDVGVCQQAGTAPLGKPEPATPSRPSGRVSTDAFMAVASAKFCIRHLAELLAIMDGRTFIPGTIEREIVKRSGEVMAELVALLEGAPQAGPCTMGVGCDEYGICYAEAHGQPDMCPKAGA